MLVIIGISRRGGFKAFLEALKNRRWLAKIINALFFDFLNFRTKCNLSARDRFEDTRIILATLEQCLDIGGVVSSQLGIANTPRALRRDREYSDVISRTDNRTCAEQSINSMAIRAR